MNKEQKQKTTTKPMAYDALLGVVAAELTEAAEIIQHLKAYGMIHPITGVVYPKGTHEEFIKKADEWLWRFRGNNVGNKKRGFVLRFNFTPTYPAMFFITCYVLAHY